MNCNNTIQCHDSRQKDNTMVQIGSLKNEMFETGLNHRNLKLSSRINRIRYKYEEIFKKFKKSKWSVTC